MVLSNIVIGTIFTIVCGIIAYLLKRLIDQYDKFQQDTGDHFTAVTKEINSQKLATTNLQCHLEKKLKEAGLDTQTKSRVSSLLAAVTKVEQELTKIRPALVKAESTNGKIIWIVDRLEAQDHKLKGLYDVMTKLVASQKP